MPSAIEFLQEIRLPLTDGENNPIAIDFAYRVGGESLMQTVDAIRRRHGDQIGLLPLSGKSAGGGVFQVSAPAGTIRIGLQLEPAVLPRISQGDCDDITRIGLDQIIVAQDRNLVFAGGAITLEQLNNAVGETLGMGFKVLGADLTSYQYAQVGSTFMTGGMGPQRRYFSDSVIAISLFDGNLLRTIEGDALLDYAGSYGWSGMVSAVCCQYFQLPHNEIAFAMPVRNTPGHLARLLDHFSDYAFLSLEDNVVTSARGHDLITGIEHITVAAMQPMFDFGPDNGITRRARQIQRKCSAAGADGVVFISGFCDDAIDELLLRLIDDVSADAPTLAGIELEHTEIFTDPEQMRAVREAVPAAARTQAPKGRFGFKGHTDANIRLNPRHTEAAMRNLWQANVDYVEAVNAVFARRPQVCGEILIYGHLNPYGVDPHNRLTFACDDKSEFDQTLLEIEQATHRFMQRLDRLCGETGSTFVGGEKGAGSELEIMAAFGGSQNAPEGLKIKFARQQPTIAAASSLFNWRAPPPYRNSS